MKELISIVIPVYNVEDYIDRCVNSVLNQSYNNIEIILVDDGSLDSSGIKCDNYIKLDNRVKVIHKENGGLSDARNAGIDIVNGDYIIFIDSDDWVSPYYVENLYNALRRDNADLAVSQFKNIYNDDNNIFNSNTLDGYLLLNKDQALEKLFYQDKIEMNAWGKIFKVEYFKKLKYPKGKLYEDIPVTYKAFTMSDKIAIINNVDYYYYQRADSIQYQNFNKRKMDAVEHITDVLHSVENNNPSLVIAAKARCFSCISNIFIQAAKSNNIECKKYLWQELKKYRKSVLFNSKARIKSKMASLISFFGSPIFILIYKVTQKRGK